MMSKKILYSITGLFDSPDAIIKAAEKVTDKGYTDYDVNTPYPVHGMDKAMKLPPSKLGYAALVFGLSGLAAALGLMYWMSVIDYANIIGGKPFFAFPAFVPIMFEVTVLSASVATVATMLFYYFKFPNNSHPLQGTEYMKQVSSDKYGISIQAKDPLFDEEKIEKLLTQLGAKNIEHIYYSNSELSVKHNIFEPKFIGMLVVIAIIVSGATYFTLNKLMFMTPFDWMSDQGKVIPQKPNDFFTDGSGMRLPVEGTVSRGNIPYSFKDDPEGAGELLVNPMIPTYENLEFGKQKYDTFCSPCHGYLGEGDSRLKGHFPNPPSLHSQKVRDWSDGRIFHVITVGQNVMPSYVSQMTRQERWASILYIRVLQRALNARETDLQ